MEETNQEIFQKFSDYISRSKVAMYQKMGVDFVPGKRKGCWIYDNETGQRVINLRSSGGVFNLGHDPEVTKNALKEALDAGIDMGDHLLISKFRADFAKYLASVLPGDLTYSVFGVSGGEAVDVAIKLARGYTKKETIISAIGGYHGHTGLAMATGDPVFKEVFKPLPSGFIQIPFGNIEEFEKVIDDNTAAIILETIQATAGVIIPPLGYFKELRRICTEKGIILIADEVQAGLGRTGRLWAIDEWDVVPDILVLGKGMSGGIYPLSVTCYRPFLQSFFDANPFIHISTAGGSDLACIVATKMLEIISDEKFLNNVNERGTQFSEGLEKLKSKSNGMITEIRQRGLFIGLEFLNDKLCLFFMSLIVKRGILALYANNRPNTLIIMPPLIINEGEVDFVINGFFDSLSEIAKSQQR